jgi:hypothetical protein
MKKGLSSLFTIFRSIICITLALLVLLSVPTGWLYDLWAGEGTEQGQRPNRKKGLKISRNHQRKRYIKNIE